MLAKESAVNWSYARIVLKKLSCVIKNFHCTITMLIAKVILATIEFKNDLFALINQVLIQNLEIKTDRRTLF